MVSMTMMMTMRFAIVLLPAMILAHGVACADETVQPARTEGRANLRGVVRDVRSEGVPNVDILLLREDGTEVAGTTTASDGTYAISCVEQGEYHLRLDPRDSGLTGQTVAAPIGRQGLVVAWTAATDKPALARGKPSGGVCGGENVVIAPPLPPDVATSGPSTTLIAIGTATAAVAVGGTFGGLAATGAFDSSSSGSNDGQPASPIQ